MHREISDRLEEVLSGSSSNPHLQYCDECRSEIELMRRHALLLRQWQPGDEAEPRPGFYARVLDRIETQRGASIWNLFFESVFGRRIAAASLALALLLGVYVVSSERLADPEVITAEEEMLPAPSMPQLDQQPGIVLASSSDRDAVLVNLVTYREQ